MRGSKLLVPRALSRFIARSPTLEILVRILRDNGRADHVIDGGRVIESGTHHELLHAKGAYARLYQLQFEGEGDQRLAV